MQLRLVTQDGNEYLTIVDNHDPLLPQLVKKILAVDRKYIDAVFLVDGCSVKAGDTVISLQLQHNDYVDVVMPIRRKADVNPELLKQMRQEGFNTNEFSYY